ncbi:MAG TPA: response regulator, partial [Polyangiaceae bacterium]
RLVEAVKLLLPKPAAQPASEERIDVLVVDDDPVQLKLLRVHLGQLGFTVREAASASEALRVARGVPPEVVVSDVLMSEMDGFQLCSEIRRDPQLSAVPVVLISAHYHTPLDSELAGKVGANALVYRTPDLEMLAPAIRRARRNGAPPHSGALSESVRLEHARAVIRQLEHQVGVNSGLARRCTLQAAQLSLLGGVADALSRRADTRLALRDVLAATLDAAAISKGALFLRRPDGRIELRSAIGFSDAELRLLERFFDERELLERAIVEKVPVSFPSSEVGERATQTILEGANVTSIEIVPLVSEGQGVGAILLGAKRGDVTNEESVVFARAIGNQIVQSLELERSFHRLSESEQRYRTLMENAHDAIAILTSDGTFKEVNGRVADLLGLPKERVIGRNLSEFVSNGHARTRQSDAPGVSRRSTPSEIRRPDGSTSYVEFSNATMDIEGEDLVFSVGRDVTEELRAQTQLLISDRMASIGMLAAGVAHEINNPLAAVVANLDLAVRDLEELPVPADATERVTALREEIGDAREAAARVRSIVRDLKLFSRAEQDVRDSVDVHRVLDSTTRMAWNEIRHRARLVKNYGVIPEVVANESRLGQVFLNLIVNAAQAIPEGHANENEVRITTQSIAQDKVLVEVSDTGCGMPADVLAKLFTPFFTTKPQGVGTGLGLTICHRLVSEIGGRISVSSELGHGTTFRIELPVGNAHLHPRRVSLPVPFTAPRARVLVVDDDALVGTAVMRSLTPEHIVEYVPTAEEALRRITAGERFDVVLCDLMMPVMTGMELYSKLEEVAPEQAQRVAFLTGGAFTPSAKEFVEKSQNPHLEKPFDLEALEHFVAGLLRR